MYGKFTGVKNSQGANIYEYDEVILADGKNGVVCYRKYPSDDRVKPEILLFREHWEDGRPKFVKLTPDVEYVKMSDDDMRPYRFASKYDYNSESKAAELKK